MTTIFTNAKIIFHRNENAKHKLSKCPNKAFIKRREGYSPINPRPRPWEALL